MRRQSKACCWGCHAMFVEFVGDIGIVGICHCVWESQYVDSREVSVYPIVLDDAFGLLLAVGVFLLRLRLRQRPPSSALFLEQ